MKKKLLSILFVGMMGCASVPVKEPTKEVEYSQEGYVIKSAGLTYNFSLEENKCTLVDQIGLNIDVMYDNDCDGNVDGLFFYHNDRYIKNIPEVINSEFKRMKKELGVNEIHQNWEEEWKR